MQQVKTGKGKFKFAFYECEHDGDLDMYIEELERCGAKVENREVDTISETGIVICTIEDRPTFRDKFDPTEAREFLNWVQEIK